MISFANLKKYTFSYWFAFPALHSSPLWVPESTGPGLDGTTGSGSSPFQTQLKVPETVALVDAVQTWRYSVDARQHGFFLAKRTSRSLDEGTHDSEGDSETDSKPLRSTSMAGETHAKRPQLPYKWAISALSAFEHGFFDDTASEDCFVCFADPSNYEESPGWMLRNLLILVRQRWDLSAVQILRYRDIQSRRDQPRSLILKLRSADGTHDTEKKLDSGSMPKVTGWERNAARKLSGRITNLTEYMNPERLDRFRLCECKAVKVVC